MPEMVGLIDGLDRAHLCGWAVSSSRRPALVVVRDDAGAVLARGPAAGERPDLASLGLCTTEVGFRLPVCLPDAEGAGRAAALHVFANGVELAGSPVRLGPGVNSKCPSRDFASHLNRLGCRA